MSVFRMQVFLSLDTPKIVRVIANRPLSSSLEDSGRMLRILQFTSAMRSPVTSMKTQDKINPPDVGRKPGFSATLSQLSIDNAQ